MKIKNLNDLKKIEGFYDIQRVLKKHKGLIDTGKLAEFWCKELFDIVLSEKPNESYDGKKGGKKIEVKYRHSNKWSKKGIPPSMEINKKNMDYLYFVKLNDDLLPITIYMFKSKHIEQIKKRVSFQEAKYEIVFQKD